MQDRDTIVEAMARAIADRHPFERGLSVAEASYFSAEAAYDAHAAAIEALGLVVVPREPTQEMLDAAFEESKAGDHMEDLYRAMIAAAIPAAPQGRG